MSSNTEAQKQIDLEALRVAHDARTEAAEARHGLESHEDICAIRYEGLEKKQGEHGELIKGLYTRAWLIAGAIITVLIASNVWFYQQGEADKKDLHKSLIEEIQKLDRS